MFVFVFFGKDSKIILCELKVVFTMYFCIAWEQLSDKNAVFMNGLG